MKVKIDLHLHSFLSRQNEDYIKWFGLFETFEKLHFHNIKIASFSDHNMLGVDFYQEAKKMAQSANILLLPAIEVNIVRLDGKIGNIIYVFDSELPISLLEEISSIAKTQIPKRGISLSTACSIFKKFDPIVIPHVGKSDHLKYDDLAKIEFDAIEISNIKNSNFVNVMKKGLETSIVSFSDTHKWDRYPEQSKLITIVEIDSLSFNDLKNAFQKNKNYSKEN